VLAAQLAVSAGDIELALLALEAQGVVLRGAFTPGQREREWCDRRLLARIHRYTLNRLRAEIEPVTAADFTRFLFRWQHVEPGHRMAGAEGLAAVLEQLEGYELAAAAWERDVLAARVERYTPQLLDALCLSGRVTWGRVSAAARGGGPPRLTRSSPIALFSRGSAALWRPPAPAEAVEPGQHAALVHDALVRHGASFAGELAGACGIQAAQVEQALAELAAAGVVTSDGFGGLRALLSRAGGRRAIESAGRWALLGDRSVERDADARERAARYARVLLRRYGVVFRRLLAREASPPAWRELVLVFRRLEARGEVRGGRFVAGVTGEQFALPEAVPALRSLRAHHRAGALIAIGAADPLNLAGIVTPGERVPALASNRVLFREGVAIAALEKRTFRWLVDAGAPDERAARAALARRPAADRASRSPVRTRPRAATTA
jgi:ATP-dependent Lhr-like helicase